MEGHKTLYGNTFHITVDNNKYAKCKTCGHHQASNAARTQVHYTKWLKEAVILAREKCP